MNGTYRPYEATKKTTQQQQKQNLCLALYVLHNYEI